ncbi:MAG: hypothetical protein R3C12_21630 [Planctomycetaceae bacterium]
MKIAVDFQRALCGLGRKNRCKEEHKDGIAFLFPGVIVIYHSYPSLSANQILKTGQHDRV